MANYDVTNGMFNAPMQARTHEDPWVEILEQPKARGLRFRYKCEGRSAGSIPGEHNTPEHRTYPKIKIHNLNKKPAIVLVSCVTKDEPKPRPHPHRLVGKDCQKGVCTVKLKETDVITFSGLGIQCATRREVPEELTVRESIRVDPYQTGYQQNVSAVDLNVVRLCFQVFLRDPTNERKFTRSLQPVTSQSIYDRKAVNDLVICRLSKHTGSVRGGEEIFLLCEKVNKDDILVRFYEESPQGGVMWEGHGDFGVNDVHRQLAIVFKTPEYRDLSITSPARVFLQLKRPSDNEVSEPKPFQYTPENPDPEGINAKMARKGANFLKFFEDTGKKTEKNLIKERIKSKARHNMAKNFNPGASPIQQSALNDSSSNMQSVCSPINMQNSDPNIGLLSNLQAPTLSPMNSQLMNQQNEQSLGLNQQHEQVLVVNHPNEQMIGINHQNEQILGLNPMIPFSVEQQQVGGMQDMQQMGDMLDPELADPGTSNNMSSMLDFMVDNSNDNIEQNIHGGINSLFQDGLAMLQQGQNQSEYFHLSDLVDQSENQIENSQAGAM